MTAQVPVATWQPGLKDHHEHALEKEAGSSEVSLKETPTGVDPLSAIPDPDEGATDEERAALVSRHNAGQRERN